MNTGKGIEGKYMQIYNLPEMISFLNSLESEEKITHIQSIFATILASTVPQKNLVLDILQEVESDLMTLDSNYLVQVWMDKKKELKRIENQLAKLKDVRTQ